MQMGLLQDSDTASPLMQGDILKDVALYETSEDGEFATPVEGVDHVLVLSRNCNALRHTTVSVAAITELTPGSFETIGDMSLGEARRRLAAVRDGDGTPDRFYLGELPGRGPRRAVARLDLIYAIRVPERDEPRRQWIDARRVATLSDEHRRHLHVRMLLAFGREGFDDHAWLSKGDLRLLIAAGTRDQAEARKKQAGAVSRYETSTAGQGGRSAHEGRIRGMSEQVGKKGDEVQEARTALQPYLEEWQRRYGDTDPLGEPESDGPEGRDS